MFISPAPANLRADETTSGDGSYTLTWDMVTGTNITYKLREGGMELSPDPPTARMYMVSNNPEGSHSYQVQACHANGACSPWSSPLIVTVSITCADTMAQASGFNYGAGTVENPYLICTYDQLKKMGVNSAVQTPLTKHYKLGAHIDAIGSYSEGTQRDGGTETCTKYNGMSGSTNAGDAGHNETCTGWKPVGDSTNAFTGSLQGAGYTIRNLYVNIASGATRGGLFGQTGSGSLIQNVGVTNAFIKVDTTSSRVGVLVGQNQGSINISYATGSVTGGINSHVGGLVGYNNGGRISNSYATGRVIGGIAGSHVGGLVGNNGGTISNSYATGEVSNTASGGGLVGRNATGGAISNSYAAGSLSIIGRAPSLYRRTSGE